MLVSMLLAAETCDPQKAICRDTAGPGVVLRVLLVVAIVGIAATAWFLLRGYRDQNRPGDE
jgi:hypothetical protein